MLDTTHALDHWFSHSAALARLDHLDGEQSNFVTHKRTFIENLEDALRGSPEVGGVTRDHLREMVALAQGDWCDVATIKGLYKRYNQIRNQPYNESEFFPVL